MSASKDLCEDQLTIGKLIQKRRKEKGMTQKKLAEEIHVTPQAVSKWEREQCEPDKQFWCAISNLLDIPVEKSFVQNEQPIVKKNVPLSIKIIANVAKAISDVQNNMWWGGNDDDRDCDDRIDS